ncbi:MAG: DUF2283 domain-containing protein [Thermoanaerobaculia bacterium]|nr:DUF2283 domain-containing protein [Thermoanaerobaculia bacterium]
MLAPTVDYDSESDTLYVAFEPTESATGIELNDHILLRLDKERGRAVGLTLFEYSVLAQHTELGPRSFPLTGLEDLAPHLHELILEILQQPPVSNFLRLSAYTPSSTESIPIAALQPLAKAA